MTSHCVVLVLISASLHVGWNLICKSKKPSGAYFLLATFASLLALLPVFHYLSDLLYHIPRRIWMLLAVTGAVQSLYYIGLGNAYRLCDVSVAYPMARALPVLMIPAVMWGLQLSLPIPLLALFGMFMVAGGCAVLPLCKGGLRQVFSRGYLFIILAALGTTGYTIIDGYSLNTLREGNHAFTPAKAALLYICTSNLFIGIYLGIYCLCHPKERKTVRELIRGHLWRPLLSGVICTSSYTIILAAMMFASNVSYVAAFRQISIPLAALCGIWLFKEDLSLSKVVGVLVIFAGLVMVALY